MTAALCRRRQTVSVVPGSDRTRGKLLEPLVREARCGFNIGQSRDELLAIESKSIEGTLDLADALLRELSTFTTESLSDRYSPRDYWCWDNRVTWPG